MMAYLLSELSHDRWDRAMGTKNTKCGCTFLRIIRVFQDDHPFEL